MDDTIRHSGIIEDITSDCIKVKIMQTSACAGCKAASHCNAAESKEKIIEVPMTVGQGEYEIGDRVTISVSSKVGFDAVVLAFVIPFILLVLTVFGAIFVTTDEALSALLGIGILIPYYIILYMLRDKIKKRFDFMIE